MGKNEATFEQIPEEEPEKTSIDEVKLNDFFKLGRYTCLVMVMKAFIGLNMLSNAFFMMFASNLS